MTWPKLAVRDVIDADVLLLVRIDMDLNVPRGCRAHSTAVSDPFNSIVNAIHRHSKESLEQFRNRFDIEQSGRACGQLPLTCGHMVPWGHAPARQTS